MTDAPTARDRRFFSHILQKLKEKQGSTKDKQRYQRFFKNQIAFFAIRTPVVKSMATEFFKEYCTSDKKKTISDHDEKLKYPGVFSLIECLARDKHMEAKQFGIELLGLFKKSYDQQVEDFAFRILEAGHWANWANVDTLYMRVLHPYLEAHPERLTQERWGAHCDAGLNQWSRRAAAVSLVTFARRGQHIPLILWIADQLAEASEDLVHKGVGWLLKEAIKNAQGRVEKFLLENAARLTRTTIRYAIEKLPEKRRLAILGLTKEIADAARESGDEEEEEEEEEEEGEEPTTTTTTTRSRR